MFVGLFLCHTNLCDVFLSYLCMYINLYRKKLKSRTSVFRFPDGSSIASSYANRNGISWSRFLKIYRSSMIHASHFTIHTVFAICRRRYTSSRGRRIAGRRSASVSRASVRGSFAFCVIAARSSRTRFHTIALFSFPFFLSIIIVINFTITSVYVQLVGIFVLCNRTLDWLMVWI